jgi:glucose/arabinose dehydrogenase
VPLTVEIVANGFVQPVGACVPPGDPTRWVVVEQGGILRMVKNGVVLPAPFLDLQNQVWTGGEEGLLGLAFHPDYATNGTFFVYYNRQPDMALVLESYRTLPTNPDVADPSSATLFLTIPKTWPGHNGGQLAFSPLDGDLYIAVGDGDDGGGPHNNSQNIDIFPGKLLRIDVDHPSATAPYSCPPGNPFFGAVPGLDEIYAIGLRNPWRISFDRLTGDLYIADVGQEKTEEIDFIPGNYAGPVKNFGWRCVEGNQCATYYGSHGCPCVSPNYSAPIYTYDHPTGCCIIGGFLYRGFNIAALSGYYFFSDLCTKKTWSLQYDGTTVSNVINYGFDLYPPDGSHSIVSYAEDLFGEVYFVYHSGEIGRVMPASLQFTGVSSYGTGTPGCTGPEELTVASPAKIGLPSFYLRATQAPPLTMGLGFLATSTGYGDPLGLGFNLLLDLYTSSDVILFNMPVDENGRGFAVFPIPNNPSVVGSTYFAQAIFYWANQCIPSLPKGFSSTNGLSLTVQG